MKKQLFTEGVLLVLFTLIFIQTSPAQTPRELAERIGQRIVTNTKFAFEQVPMKLEQEKVHIFDFSQLKNYKPGQLYLEQFTVAVDKSLVGRKDLAFAISSTKGMITVNFQLKTVKNYTLSSFESLKMANVERIDYDLIKFDTSRSVFFDTTYAEIMILFAPDSLPEARVYLGLLDSNKMMVGGLKIEPKDTINWLPTPSVSSLAGGNQNMADWRYYNGTLAIAMHDTWQYFGLDNLKTYLPNHTSFFIENKDKIKAEREKYGLLDSPFTLYFRGNLLDDLGMQTAAMAVANTQTTPNSALFKQQNALITEGLEKIKTRIPTLSDGTFTRVTPDSLTVQSDDLMMGGYALLRTALAQRRPSLIADVVAQSRGFHQYLLDKQTGLYRHAYSTKTGEQSCCSWARGMGWMMLVNTDLLKEFNPKTSVLGDAIFSHLPFGKDVESLGILKNYKASCAALLKYQAKNGGFHEVLTDSTTYIETSATAMFVYAFAEGVNNGWLPKADYEAAILRGWSYLKTQIQEDGRVKNIVRGTPILPTADAYNKQKVNLNDPRGLGAMLWVCRAMDRFLK